MPFARFLQSLASTCHHCGQQAGILQRTHSGCRQTHQTGIQDMTKLAAQAAVPTPSTKLPFARPSRPSQRNGGVLGQNDF